MSDDMALTMPTSCVPSKESLRIVVTCKGCGCTEEYEVQVGDVFSLGPCCKNQRLKVEEAESET